MKKVTSFFLVFFLLSTAWTQVNQSFHGGVAGGDAVLGTLHGTVTDSGTGIGIEGVEVTAGTHSTTTSGGSNAGQYYLVLPSGTYDVIFTHPDYYTVVVENVVISLGNPVLLDTALQQIPPGGACNKAIDLPLNAPAVEGTLLPGEHWWYSFTVTQPETGVVISACESDFDTKLAVWADCDDFAGWPPSGMPQGVFAYNDDQCGMQSLIDDGTEQSSGVTLPDTLLPGTYYVTVYGYDAVQTGTYTLEIYNIPASQTGWINGVVTDPLTKNPVVDVTVAAGEYSTQTTSDGTYSLAVEAGTYDVTAQKEGYITDTIGGVSVEAGETVTVDFNLDFSSPVLVSADPTAYSVTLTWNGNPLFVPEQSKNRRGFSFSEKGKFIIHGKDRDGRASGNNCANPIVMDSLPFFTTDSTCGRVNNYDTTCLGFYDEGEDVIFRLDISEIKNVKITLETTTLGTGMLLTDECPGGEECIAMATNPGSGGCSVTSILPPGSYFLMIDTRPPASCIPEFNLTVEEEFMNHYEIYRTGTTRELLAVSYDTSFVDTTVVNGETYCYEIMQIATPEISIGPSNELCATVPYPPEIHTAPSEMSQVLGFDASASQTLTITNSGQLPLTWEAECSYMAENKKGLIITDDMEAYIPGEKLVEQALNMGIAYWTTWDNNPGSSSDPSVSDYVAYSGDNALKIDGYNDCVMLLGDKTSGIYQYDFKINVPQGFLGFFSLLHSFDGDDSEYGLVIYFYLGNVGVIKADGYQSTFHFENDRWIDVSVFVNLNDDRCSVYINKRKERDYTWSKTLSGDQGLNSLAAADFMAWEYGGLPTYFIDDIKYTEINPWLNINPVSGVVPPGQGTVNIYADFNSSDLEMGEYSAGITIFSDDPVNPEVVVPVQLLVGGVITGTVTDAFTKSVVKGATVTATSADNFYTCTTGPDGKYFITAPSGIYEVTVSKTGYVSQSATDIDVTVGESSVRDFELEFASPELTAVDASYEKVTLTWEYNPLLNPQMVWTPEKRGDLPGVMTAKNTAAEPIKQQIPEIKIFGEQSGKDAGNTCENPLVIPSIPYEDVNTTCGRGNNYNETCLDDWDEGEDIVYELVLTQKMFLKFTLTTMTRHTALLVTQKCPVDDLCDFWYMSVGLTGNLDFQEELDAGTYYIMIDNKPGADCIEEFTFSIEEGTPDPGQICQSAVQAVEGMNFCPGAPYWYEFTPEEDRLITISSCLENQKINTELLVYDSCNGALIDHNNNLSGACPYNSEASAVTFVGEAGHAYKFLWNLQFSSRPFEFTVEYADYCNVECPPDAVMSPEPCPGFQYNDTFNCGCSGDTAVFEPIECGQTVCATASTYRDNNFNKVRDTDWYILVLDEPTKITLTGQAQFPLIFGLIEQYEPGVPGCDNLTGKLNPYVMADPCEEASFAVDLIPGTYYLFASLSVYSGFECGKSGAVGLNNYWITVDCEDVFLPYTEVFRNGSDSAIAILYQGNTYVDSAVTQGETYCYSIAGHLSPAIVLGPSDTLCATVPIPPAISVTPGALTESLNQGELSSQIITVTNAGSGTLNFDVEIDFNPPGDKTAYIPPKDFGPAAKMKGGTAGTKDFDLECPPQAIISQPPVDASSTYLADEEKGFVLFQSFAQPFVMNITGLRFWSVNAYFSYGSWYNCTGADPKTFNVCFYEDDNGLPGAMLEEFTLELSRNNTGEMYNGIFPVYEYTAAFPSTVTLTEGWFSVQALQDPLYCWSLFLNEKDGTVGACLQWDGSEFSALDNPLGFCFTGEISDPWLTVDPASGSLAPGGESALEINADFSANSLNEGTYRANILIGSNDPLNPLVTVPVELTIDALLTQNITLRQGWGGWSSYGHPEDPTTMDELLAPVADKMILTQFFDRLYYPAYGINTMGDFTNSHGYISKMTEPAALPVTGYMADNHILLSDGWNLLPVISTCATDVTLLGAVDGFVIAWDIAGDGIYYPEYGINTLGDMIPGAAYYVKMEGDGTFVFPDCSDFLRIPYAPVRIKTQTPWNPVNYTGVAHVAVFSEEALSKLNPGSIIGAFSADGKCNGIAIVPETGNVGMKMFADDPTSSGKDGFAENELLQYKAFDPGSGEAWRLEAVYDENAPDADGRFTANGLSVITGLTINASGVGVPVSCEFYIYPNPSSGIFTVAANDNKGEIDYTVINTKGEPVFTGRFSGTCRIDLSTLPKGIYFIRFTDNASVWNKKIVVK